MMKRYVLLILVILLSATVVGCNREADVASRNVKAAADSFEVTRRVVFFNGITDEYLLSIEGYCSVTADTVDQQLEVICLTGPDEYKLHFLGLSDNVSYFIEQLEGVNASAFHYRVFFRPTVILPDIDIETP